MQNRIVLEVASLPENIGLCRLAVAALAGNLGFSVSDIEEIKVAVSEAVTNAVVHGYGGRADGVVRLESCTDSGGLYVAVEDWGCGIADVAQARTPAFTTDPERMGLGFVFMENFMDGVEVASSPGHGTRVVMRKALQDPSPGQALASGAN